MNLAHNNTDRQAKVLRNRFAGFLGETAKSPDRCGDPALTAPLWGLLRPDSDDRRLRDEGRRRKYIDYAQTLIHAAVSNVVGTIKDNWWEAYVVGGTLRDLMLARANSSGTEIVPRDIDVVVLGIPLRELEATFGTLTRRRTRFGGLHLVKEIAPNCEVHFDVWPLSETWAFRECGIKADIEHFPLTPFFNLDAVAVELFPQPGHERRIYEHGFFQGIKTKTIDISFAPNPFPDVCAIRALFMAARLQFSMTLRLAMFICDRARDAGIAALEEAQRSHYGRVRCGGAELQAWLAQVRGQVSARAALVTIEVPAVRQMQLCFDHPKFETPVDHDGPEILDPVKI